MNMKRILKLALPPVLAVILILGYGSGTIEAMARTVASWVTTVTMTETDGPTMIVEKTFVAAFGGAPSGEGWTFVDAGSVWAEYKRSVSTVTAINTDVTTQVLTEVTVPDEPQVSDKVVPEEKPLEERSEEPEEEKPREERSEEPEEPQTAENNYVVFHDTVKKMIKDTAAGQGTITIDTKNWISFRWDVYQELQDSGRPVQITFSYRGERYRVDIPAGADLMSLVDENGYCGFLNLMAHFGGTKL